MDVVDDAATTLVTGDCPSRAELARFASGGTEIGVDLSEHVATCARCSAIVARGTLPMEDPPSALAPGTLVGRYEVLEVLGQGGMGIVYRARDSELDREVALKLVGGSAQMLDELTERLRRESRLQARAAHPAVITVHDIGRDGDRLYVAMELARGGTLRAWLRARPRSWRDIVEVFRRAGEGLAAAHAAGLVHRDFKPDNVLVEDRDGRVARVLVTDFGVARALEAAEQSSTTLPTRVDVTVTGAMLGTPAYMAPEQLAAGTVDARTDVFAFAVGLWEAVHGSRPYGGLSITEIVLAMSEPLSAVRTHGVPRWLDRVLRRALAIEPAKRYQSMTELLAALDRGRRHTRRTRLAAAGVLAAAAVAGGVAVQLQRTDEATPSVCELDPGAGPALLAAAERVRGLELPVASRTMCVDGATTSARVVTGARPASCASGQHERVRCLDASALGLAMYLDDLAAAPRDVQLRLVRNAPVAAPIECLSERPPQLRGELVVLGQAAALRIQLDDADARHDVQTLGRVAAVGEALGLHGITHEAAVRRASYGSPEQLRDAAAAAERDGELGLAASAWLTLVERLIDPDQRRARDLLAQGDNTIERAGNPPRLRARWYALQAFFAANTGDAAAMDRAVAAARATIARGQVPFDPMTESVLARAQMRIGHYAEALALAEAVIRYVDARSEDDVGARNLYATVLAASGRQQDGIAALEPVVAGADPRTTSSRDTVMAAGLLASAYNQANRSEDALRVAAAWIAAIDRVLPRSTNAAAMRMHGANAAFSLGRFADAERGSAGALEIFVERLGAAHYDTADARILHGQALVELHQVARGREEIERGLADLSAATTPDDPLVIQGHIVLAEALVREGNAARALVHLEPAFDRYVALVGDPKQTAATNLVYARALLAANRDRARAKQLVAQAIAAWSGDREHARELAEAKALGKRLR